MTELAASPLDWIIAVLLVAGSLFALVGSFGLAKLSDFYRRLHGPTKATTLGVGSLLIASSLYFTNGGIPSLRELLVALFLFVTAPVSAQLLVKSAIAEHHQKPPERGRYPLAAEPPPPPPDSKGDATLSRKG